MYPGTSTGELVTVFRERFSEIPELLGINDSTLAARLEVSRQTVSAWKSGERSPRKPMIEMIAQKCGISVSWLCGYDVPPFGEYAQFLLNEEERDLILAFRTAEKTAREYAKELLESHAAVQRIEKRENESDMARFAAGDEKEESAE